MLLILVLKSRAIEHVIFIHAFSSVSGGGDVVSLSDFSQHDESIDNFSETASEKNVDIEKSSEDCR